MKRLNRLYWIGFAEVHSSHFVGGFHEVFTPNLHAILQSSYNDQYWDVSCIGIKAVVGGECDAFTSYEATYGRLSTRQCKFISSIIDSYKFKFNCTFDIFDTSTVWKYLCETFHDLLEVSY